MSIWYHHTKPERINSILKFGLKPNSQNNKVEDGLGAEETIRELYKYGTPIFVTKDLNMFKDPGDVTLKLELKESELLPDFPSLIDSGAHVEEYGNSYILYWETSPDGKIDPYKEFDIEDEGSYSELIAVTNTASTFQEILPSKIKLMKESKLILEFGKSDFNSVIEDSQNFTIAYEIELEESSNADKFGFNKDMDIRYDQMYDSLRDNDFDINDFRDIYQDEDEIDYRQGYIRRNFDNYVSSSELDFDDNFSYGNVPDLNREDNYFPFNENEIYEEFPNFFRNWGSKVNLKPDITLDKGFEIIPKSYFSSIDESFNFLESFFNDYYDQERFELNANTGWHINIGFKGVNLGKMNLLKGAILLSDEFATKDFSYRLKGDFAKPIRNLLIKSIKDRYDYDVGGENLMKKVFSNNIEEIERIGNNFLFTTGTTTKEYGFNPRGRYIEFRYPGGKLTPNQIKEATLYYCYIIKAIVDPSFKRKEYIKKLYKVLFDGDI